MNKRYIELQNNTDWKKMFFSDTYRARYTVRAPAFGAKNSLEHKLEDF